MKLKPPTGSSEPAAFLTSHRVFKPSALKALSVDGDDGN